MSIHLDTLLASLMTTALPEAKLTSPLTNTLQEVRTVGVNLHSLLAEGENTILAIHAAHKHAAHAATAFTMMLLNLLCPSFAPHTVCLVQEHRDQVTAYLLASTVDASLHDFSKTVSDLIAHNRDHMDLTLATLQRQISDEVGCLESKKDAMDSNGRGTRSITRPPMAAVVEAETLLTAVSDGRSRALALHWAIEERLVELDAVVVGSSSALHGRGWSGLTMPEKVQYVVHIVDVILGHLEAVRRLV
ncbi:hypothetical protein OF83DRAFT_1083830 [Amylostereum chailletii]|nr:hypothetical protein OF83DRAFT_1083830 [Amylostereum chailletii]